MEGVERYGNEVRIRKLGVKGREGGEYRKRMRMWREDERWDGVGPSILTGLVRL